MKALKYGIKAVQQGFPLLALILLMPLFSSFHTMGTEPRGTEKFTVVLDAGHGGHDPGNLGNGYYEKNIALNIVLKAGAILEQNPDIKVIYTRKDDRFVDLYVRGQIANKAGADLFVSVHCDSHTSQAQGAGTFVLGLHANKQNFEIAKKENSVIYLEDDYKDRYADYDINSPESVIGLTIMQEEFLDQSIALAKDIQGHFVKMDRVDRKVKQAGFIVLHQTVMPSVLVETGFLTNKKEGAYLDSKKGQDEMGEAIGKAILSYKESSMANRADFDPVAMAQAPDPEDAGINGSDDADAGNKNVSGRADADNGEASDTADAARNAKGSKVADNAKDTRDARRKARREKKQNAVIERDAATASTKETAQIIEEARNRSQTESDVSIGSSGPDTAVGGSGSNAASGSSGSSEGPAEVVVSARPKPIEREDNPQKTKENSGNTGDKAKEAAPGSESSRVTSSETASSRETSSKSASSGETSSKSTSSEAPRITYKVQIMASAKNLPLRPASFNGLNKVAKEPYNNLYRYVYGTTSSLREAEMLKSNADIKGYPSSFIAVYRDGERITFKESREFLSKQ